MNLINKLEPLKRKYSIADKQGQTEEFHSLYIVVPRKPVDVHPAAIPENARIGDCYQSAKFHACIKKCIIGLKFRVIPPDYTDLSVCPRNLKVLEGLYFSDDEMRSLKTALSHVILKYFKTL